MRVGRGDPAGDARRASWSAERRAGCSRPSSCSRDAAERPDGREALVDMLVSPRRRPGIGSTESLGPLRPCALASRAPVRAARTLIVAAASWLLDGEVDAVVAEQRRPLPPHGGRASTPSPPLDPGAVPPASTGGGAGRASGKGRASSSSSSAEARSRPRGEAGRGARRLGGGFEAHHITNPAPDGAAISSLVTAAHRASRPDAGRHRLRECPRHGHLAQRRLRGDGARARTWRRDHESAGLQLEGPDRPHAGRGGSHRGGDHRARRFAANAGADCRARGGGSCARPRSRSAGGAASGAGPRCAIELFRLRRDGHGPGLRRRRRRSGSRARTASREASRVSAVITAAAAFGPFAASSTPPRCAELADGRLASRRRRSTPMPSSTWPVPAGSDALAAHRCRRRSATRPSVRTRRAPLGGLTARAIGRSGSAFGNVDGCAAFMHRIFEKGPRAASPAEFPNLVPSSPVGHMSIYLGLRGVSFATADLGASGESAFAQAVELVRSGEIGRVVAGAVEPKSDLVERVFAALFAHAASQAGAARADLAAVVVVEDEGRGAVAGPVCSRGCPGDRVAACEPSGRADPRSGRLRQAPRSSCRAPTAEPTRCSRERRGARARASCALRRWERATPWGPPPWPSRWGAWRRGARRPRWCSASPRRAGMRSR